MSFWCWIGQIGGMSDLCMYELEDIVWDEFDQTDDHIVPHHCYEHGIEPAFQGGSCKKPRREVIGISRKAADYSIAKYVSQVKGRGGFQPLKNAKDTMLEKDSWSHTPGGVFPALNDSDLNKEATRASDNSRMAGNTDTIGTEFCADDPIIGESCAVVDSNSYRYPLGDISQTDNDHSFFDNDREDKESNDLLYYGWPDIGNFEDVDRMFRSCDSTFGLGGVGSEDELSWFSSSHNIDGSEDLLKSDFKFSCPETSPFKNIQEEHEPSNLNNTISSVNDSNMDSASMSYKYSFRASEGGEPESLGNLTFTNGSDATSESKDKFTPKQQGVEFNGAVHFNISTANHSKDDNGGMINFYKKQAKHQNQSEGKRKDRCLENGDSFHHTGNIRFKNTKLPSGDSSCQAFTSPVIQKQKKNIGPKSFGCLQTHIPCMHLDYSHPSDQIPVHSAPSGIKSESNGLTSLSTKESSYASNQVQSMESSHDRTLEAGAITMDDKREKLQCRQEFHSSYLRNPEHLDLVVQTTSCDPILVPKHVHHSQNEGENHSEVKGAGIRTPADLDSSNAQESSCVSSGLDEISLEASSFRQLQQVMEQLDIRTKLCIRDSLYRLARSAEQRHPYANLNGGSIDDRDTSGALMAEGTKKWNGIMDIETDTNPIDRSIAHLLFHRPSDSSVMPAHDGLSLKSRTMISGSTTSPNVTTEKLVSQEGTASEADKKSSRSVVTTNGIISFGRE